MGSSPSEQVCPHHTFLPPASPAQGFPGWRGLRGPCTRSATWGQWRAIRSKLTKQAHLAGLGLICKDPVIG